MDANSLPGVSMTSLAARLTAVWTLLAIQAGCSEDVPEEVGETQAASCSPNCPPPPPFVSISTPSTTTAAIVSFTTTSTASLPANSAGVVVATLAISPYGSNGTPLLGQVSDASASSNHTLWVSYLTPNTNYRYDLSVPNGQKYTGWLTTANVSGGDDTDVAKAIGSYLDGELGPRSAGHTWAVAQFGQVLASGGGGYSVWPWVAETGNTRMTVMSMSKTITAAAVVKAIQDLAGTGITLDSPIFPYLPTDWQAVAGGYVPQMTFREILTHTAGLYVPMTGGNHDTYADLKVMIQNGATPQTRHVYNYLNGDFCLLRVVLPYLVNGRAAYTATEQNGTNDLATGQAYVAYVQSKIFAPIGLGDVTVLPTGPTPYVRYYDVTNYFNYYTDPTDNTPFLGTGAGFWFLSASEYARFRSSLEQGPIISPASYDLMINTAGLDPNRPDARLGLYATNSTSPFPGPYYDHNGGLQNEGGDWMRFPNGMTVTMMANSNSFTGVSNPQSLVRDAFDQAVAPPIFNGNFEQGSLVGWQTTGAVSTSANLRRGYFAAQVGSSSAFPGDSTLAQTFVAPAGGMPTLSFFYKMITNDTVSYDWATATLADLTAGTTSTILAKTCASNGWRQVLAALTPNHQYRLTILNHDDGVGADPTYTLVDDVQILPTAPTWAPITRGSDFETGDTFGWWTWGAAASMYRTYCHSGSYCLQLGASTATAGESNAGLLFTAPAGSSSVSFNWFMSCPDNVIYDWATATLTDYSVAGAPVTTVLAKTCVNTASWQTASASIVPDHVYLLTLTNRDDDWGADPSYTIFDDVVMQ
jgi:CubicO group peptidase (beta-lactamase class C family)